MFVRAGDMIAGFYKIDVAQYDGDVLKAAAHTFILHVWPLLVSYTELYRCNAELRKLYADVGVRTSW